MLDLKRNAILSHHSSDLLSAVRPARTNAEFGLLEWVLILAQGLEKRRRL
jgi:hypothetical protein